MRIAVLGAGAFGTALAVALVENWPVLLWARNADDVRAMEAARENIKRLPGVDLPAGVSLTSDPGDLAQRDVILLCVPLQTLRNTLRTHRQLLDGKTLIACCKGMELDSGAGPHDIIASECPGASVAVLTGPSFAKDIARGLPTALTLACADADLGERLQHALTCSALRLYRTTDVKGAALGGALKNVIAIACGAAMGAGLGESARAALMTRGNAEMQRLAAHLGADPSTLVGLSGFGDLVLTCTSAQSRNYRRGLAIGEGTAFPQDTTVEGAATAQAMAELAKKNALDMPIATVVAALLEKRLDVGEALDLLLSRTLKEE